MSKTAITYNLAGFQKAIRRVAAAKGRAGADILNRATLTVLIGAKGTKGLVHITKKATRARIVSDMQKPVVGRFGNAMPRVHWLALSWLRKRGVKGPSIAEIEAASTAIINARIKSRAYIAAGWLWAAADLAKKAPGHKLTRLEKGNMPTMWDGGTARAGFAVPASVGKSKQRVSCYNTSRGADIISEPMIPQAVANVIADLEAYFYRKMGEAVARAVAVR